MTTDLRQAWIDGDPIEGVVHGFHEYVRIADGPEAGHYGYVMSLVTLKPEVVFMVGLPWQRVRRPGAAAFTGADHLAMPVVDLQPVLRGGLLEARPLRSDDFDALFTVAADPLIWEQHPASDRYQEAVFREFFHEALDSRGAFLISDVRDGAVIGLSRYFGHDPERREIEIGWTFLARRCWGGRYNGELKRLMLGHAFGFVDRVLFLVGPQNIRSQRAVEKIGGRRIGSRIANGRESVVFELTTAVHSEALAIGADAAQIGRMGAPRQGSEGIEVRES